MLELVIIEDITNPDSFEVVDVDDIGEYLMSRYSTLPVGSKLYHEYVSELTDVTPFNEDEINKLLRLQGRIYFIIQPQGFEPITWVAIALLIASVAVAVFIRPKLPQLDDSINSQTSSNNALSDRTNNARVNGRIPDIFGKVRSYPDLIMLPYKYFAGNVEYEYSVLCIGRGSFEVSEIREGETPCKDITDISVTVWNPGFNPKNDPHCNGVNTQIGVYNYSNWGMNIFTRHTAVNNEEILISTTTGGGSGFIGNNDVRFWYSSITGKYGLQILHEYNENNWINSIITIANSTVTTPACNFDGSYKVLGINTLRDELGVFMESWVWLEDPTMENSNWLLLKDIPGEISSLGSPIISIPSGIVSGGLGPFTISNPKAMRLIFNFVAQKGLFEYTGDNGNTYNQRSVIIRVTVTPIDMFENEIGIPQISNFTLYGSTNRNKVDVYYTCAVDIDGRCKVYIERITPKIVTSNACGDEVTLRDMYVVEQLPQNVDFGDVTIVSVLTKANNKVLNLKERKLNVLCTRKIPMRISGNIFSALTATRNFADIVTFISLDPKIGRRVLSELDLDSIYNTCNEIEVYFGTNRAIEFCYTFDKENISFEETIQMIANSCFCVAIRKANKLRFNFEKPQNIATILFNHRNKIPNTEVRTFTFGNTNDYDGVTLDYVDSLDMDSRITYYVPEDMSATNPKKLEIVGIRNTPKAHFHAYREYNKILKSHTVVEFEGTEESNIVALNDLILVADNTRDIVSDGEILQSNGLFVKLSQTCGFDWGDCIIFLQLYDGTIDSITASRSMDDYTLRLHRAPRLPLVINDENYCKTTYLIVRQGGVELNGIAQSDMASSEFLVVEKGIKDNHSSKVVAINYTIGYYTNDDDYKDGYVFDLDPDAENLYNYIWPFMFTEDSQNSILYSYTYNLFRGYLVKSNSPYILTNYIDYAEFQISCNTNIHDGSSYLCKSIYSFPQWIFKTVGRLLMSVVLEGIASFTGAIDGTIGIVVEYSLDSGKTYRTQFFLSDEQVQGQSYTELRITKKTISCLIDINEPGWDLSKFRVKFGLAINTNANYNGWYSADCSLYNIFVHKTLEPPIPVDPVVGTPYYLYPISGSYSTLNAHPGDGSQALGGVAVADMCYKPSSNFEDLASYVGHTPMELKGIWPIPSLSYLVNANKLTSFCNELDMGIGAGLKIYYDEAPYQFADKFVDISNSYVASPGCNFNGRYKITNMARITHLVGGETEFLCWVISLENPSAINSNWALLDPLPNKESDTIMTAVVSEYVEFVPVERNIVSTIELNYATYQTGESSTWELWACFDNVENFNGVNISGTHTVEYTLDGITWVNVIDLMYVQGTPNKSKSFTIIPLTWVLLNKDLANFKVRIKNNLISDGNYQGDFVNTFSSKNYPVFLKQVLGQNPIYFDGYHYPVSGDYNIVLGSETSNLTVIENSHIEYLTDIKTSGQENLNTYLLPCGTRYEINTPTPTELRIVATEINLYFQDIIMEPLATWELFVAIESDVDVASSDARKVNMERIFSINNTVSPKMIVELYLTNSNTTLDKSFRVMRFNSDYINLNNVKVLLSDKYYDFGNPGSRQLSANYNIYAAFIKRSYPKYYPPIEADAYFYSTLISLSGGISDSRCQTLTETPVGVVWHHAVDPITNREDYTNYSILCHMVGNCNYTVPSEYEPRYLISQYFLSFPRFYTNNYYKWELFVSHSGFVNMSNNAFTASVTIYKQASSWVVLNRIDYTFDSVVKTFGREFVILELDIDDTFLEDLTIILEVRVDENILTSDGSTENFEHDIYTAFIKRTLKPQGLK